MYLWLIIATFIAALAAMGTSLRTDMRELYVEPQAQNVVTKLYTQHRAALKYVIAKRNTGENGAAAYEDGNLSPASLNGYLPYGFNAGGGMAQFTTKIYCLDRNSSNHANPPPACYSMDPSDPSSSIKTGNCCSVPGSIVYVVTFGAIPGKWQNIRTGKPNKELLGAMKDTLGYINGFGYVESKEHVYTGPTTVTEGGQTTNYPCGKYNILCTDYGIAGQGTHPYTALPQAVISDGDFASCLTNYCLVYMSSM
ncbi:MAG: hypothetical protein IJ529_02445 [Alphaproteobacteria bacterium]|nr:hypothetical protein [Alphaproteobacteria bacterium]